MKAPIAAVPDIAASPRVGGAERLHAYIESLYVVLPQQRLSTQEVMQGCVNKCDFGLEHFTGIASRAVASPGMYSRDLARAAAVGCLERSRHAAAHIDLVICCNISRVDGPGFRIALEPTTAVRLKRELGLTRAHCFDVSNACAGMWTAIAVVEAYFRSGAAHTALVVSGEYITHLMSTAQREIDTALDSRLACLTVGDSGAALLLESTARPDVGFRDVALSTYAQYADYCIAQATDQPHGGAIMHTDAIRMTAAAVRCGAAHVDRTLQARSDAWAGAEHVIMHQTSTASIRSMADLLAKRFGLGKQFSEKVVYNVAQRGNTATTSYFVALWDCIQSGRITDGEQVAFAISGSGLTVGSARYLLDDLPARVRQATKPSPVGERLRLARDQSHAWRLAVLATGEAVQDDNEQRVGSVELARRAASRCIETAGIQRAQIDLIIHVGVYQDNLRCEPATAVLLAKALGVNPNENSTHQSFAFDLSNGVLGFLEACEVAGRMLADGWGEHALVVASDIDVNRGLGAEAVAVERGTAVLVAAGRRYAQYPRQLVRCVFAEVGAPELDHEAYAEQIGSRLRVQHVLRHGSRLARLQTVEAAVSTLLAEHGTSADAVGAVLTANLDADEQACLAESLSIPLSRWRSRDAAVIRDRTSSALPHALHLESGLSGGSGKLALMIGIASGGQIGCALYQL